MRPWSTRLFNVLRPASTNGFRMGQGGHSATISIGSLYGWALVANVSKSTRHRKRYKLKRAWRRMLKRRKNWLRDFHYRLAHWLCRTYSVVLWPEFFTSYMVKRSGRRIKSKVVRSMVHCNPHVFKQRLLYIAGKYRGCNVHIVNEAYTSKTCGRCGALHANLGGSQIFRCAENACGFVCERDINGGRNILLRPEQDLVFAMLAPNSVSSVWPTTQSILPHMPVNPVLSL